MLNKRIGIKAFIFYCFLYNNSVRSQQNQPRQKICREICTFGDFLADALVKGTVSFLQLALQSRILELTKEIAEENGLKIDEEGFKNAMREQKERAKIGRAHV